MSSTNKQQTQSQTNLSILTKNSGEQDYNEISYLIKAKVTNQNSSIASKTQTLNNTETSLISNMENWIGESEDDSKQFEMKFNKISEVNEEKKQKEKQKINNGTLPMSKLKMTKLKSSSLFNEDKSKVILSKDSKESFKFNLNSNIYVPSTMTNQNQACSTVSQAKNKKLDLVLSISEDNEGKSKSFVNNIAQNNQLMFPISPKIISNMNGNRTSFNHAHNSNVAYSSSTTYSINSGTTFSCTPKAGKHHQKFVSDHSIQVKPLSSKNNQSEDGFQFILTPTKYSIDNSEMIHNQVSQVSQQSQVSQTCLNTKKNESKSIVIESILSGKDKRTTIMLRNIPLKYTINNLVDELNMHFNGKYDFVNLPINQESKLNLGYAFINFNDPFHLILFNEVFQDRQWMKFKSDKKTSINYAEKQGKKEGGVKDESMYYAPKPKQSVGVDIPIKYYDVFKRILPHSDLYFPKNSIKKTIPVFVVKKIY